MANKRIDELNELLRNQVDANDLFLISDLSALESKKIRADELQAYIINGGSITGSFNGTASYAIQAKTASWAPPCISASYALSASYADLANTTSYVVSSSYGLSSSWADKSYYSVTSSYALTSSVQLVISSGMSNFADTASFMWYDTGRYNGRISYADASTASTSSFTSSYLLYTGRHNGSASYALTASSVNTSSFSRTASFAKTASFAETASYATTSSYAETASYAVTSSYVITSSYSEISNYSNYSSFISRPMGWTIISPQYLTQTMARINTMSLFKSNGAIPTTYITVTGTVDYKYINFISESVALFAVNQTTTTSSFYDMIPISSRMESTMGDTFTGSVSHSFTLQGEVDLPSGSYSVYLTASSTNLTFDATRRINFRIDSNADNFLYSV